MRRVAVVLGLALATVGVGGTVASAAQVPPGLEKKGVQVFHCDDIGTVEIVAAAGRVGIDATTGDRYALRSIVVDVEDIGIVESKQWNGGPPGTPIDCAVTYLDTPDGDVTISITVVRIPAR